MVRLVPHTARAVVKKLKKDGFKKTHQRGAHAFYVSADGERVVTVPMHGGDIPIGTLYSIVVHQAKISVEKFMNL